MKLLICPDKFKGTLSALAVCQSIAKGLQHSGKAIDYHFHPMADGGDGSLAILSYHLPLIKQELSTTDPLGRPIFSHYYTFENIAFIELASASGLVLLKADERNPLYTSTQGTGKMLAHAIANGCQKIYLFLGGSATNDAGMGIAHELGYRFLDQAGQVLAPIGENLAKVQSIHKDKDFFDAKPEITLLCDVNNPLFGPNGAAIVYGPQKGANKEEVTYLEEGLKHYEKILLQNSGVAVAALPGAGAAGGIAASLVALFGAQLKNGFQSIAGITQLEVQIQQADWVISGEGRLDSQSLQGKVVGEVARLCQQYQKPLTLFVGKNDLSIEDQAKLEIKGIYAIADLANDLKDSMDNASQYLTKAAADLKVE